MINSVSVGVKQLPTMLSMKIVGNCILFAYNSTIITVYVAKYNFMIIVILWTHMMLKINNSIILKIPFTMVNFLLFSYTRITKCTEKMQAWLSCSLLVSRSFSLPVHANTTG